MYWPSETLDIPQPLRDGILNGKYVTFLGSGASADCYYNWIDLINTLCEKCDCDARVSEIDPVERYLKVAQQAKDTNPQQYFEFLLKHFGQRPLKTTFLYRHLIKLPFQHYLTVNFDPLLMEESKEEYLYIKSCDPDIKSYPKLPLLTNNERTIFYLHGKVDHGVLPKDGSIVLSESEFESAYSPPSPLMHLLVAFLKEYPLCFIGCKLREPQMKHAFEMQEQHKLDQEKAGRGTLNPKPRYIFFQRDKNAKSLEEAKANMEKDEARMRGLDITVIWYNQHEDLLESFKELATKYRYLSSQDEILGGN